MINRIIRWAYRKIMWKIDPFYMFQIELMEKAKKYGFIVNGE